MPSSSHMNQAISEEEESAVPVAAASHLSTQVRIIVDQVSGSAERDVWWVIRGIWLLFIKALLASAR